jgi:hypothetical protein
MKPLTLRDFVLSYINTDGPVSIQSIRHEVRSQFDSDTKNYEIAAELTRLLQKGLVVLHDDGKRFNKERGASRRFFESFGPALGRCTRRPLEDL